MLALFARMPALAPAALRRLEMAHCSLQAVLGAMAGWLFGPGGLLPALVFIGGASAGHATTDVALRRWARRRALPFIPRREWRAAWRDATYAASVPAILVRSLLFGLAVAQVAQGRPAWALDSNGWAAVAICAVFWFLLGLWSRGSAAADASAATGRKAASKT